MVKNPPATVGDPRDLGYIPGLGRSPGVRNGNLLQYSFLEIYTDRGAWWATSVGSQRVGHDRACTNTFFGKSILKPKDW